MEPVYDPADGKDADFEHPDPATAAEDYARPAVCIKVRNRAEPRRTAE
ncbi:hypothetical protein AB0I93_02570 [Streptomyces sp. NPDC049967]|nr:hypothetical protein [Streptomyces sp. NBC_00342]